MKDKIVIESDSMTVRSLDDSKNLILCVMNTSKPDGFYVNIRNMPYGNQLEKLLGKRLRVTIEVLGDNVF